MRPHVFPVVRDLADRMHIQPGVAVRAVQRLDQRAQRRLAGVARERIHRRVDRIHPGLGGGKDAGAGDAGGVVGVEMDRQADLVLQRLHQRPGGGRLQQPRHVLQPQHMRAGGLQLLGHADIVFQVVFGPVRVAQVAGIADRAFADLAGGDHRIHRHPHVLDPVQRIEHPEHVDPRGLPPARRSFAPRCRDSWYSRRRSSRAAASASSGSASPRAGRAAAARGIPAGSDRRRRRSRRPSIRPTAARGRLAA